jgi:hypothetical protein
MPDPLPPRGAFVRLAIVGLIARSIVPRWMVTAFIAVR